MGRFSRTIDPVSLIALLFLCSFGLFVLLTIGQQFFSLQLLFLLAGFSLLFMFSRIDTAILWWAAPVAYVVSNILLLLTYVGTNVRGATRWIMLGPIQLQPSELVKPFLILSFAYFMTQYSPRSLKHAVMHFFIFLLPFVLVFRQPDLGSSVVYACFWLSMIIARGLSLRVVLLFFIVAGLLFPVFWNVLAPYQQARIGTFLDPGLDPTGAGYNALQSTIAVGSGQLFGRGLGMGTQSHLRFLPEYHTDFIFATMIEELGLLGGFLLFVGYFVLLWQMVSLYLHGSDSVFGYCYTLGIFGMLLSQIAINTGMNMGIVPITGITLPFVSYGGSSILSSCMSMGLLWAFRYHEQVGRRMNKLRYICDIDRS